MCPTNKGEKSKLDQEDSPQEVEEEPEEEEEEQEEVQEKRRYKNKPNDEEEEEEDEDEDDENQEMADFIVGDDEEDEEEEEAEVERGDANEGEGEGEGEGMEVEQSHKKKKKKHKKKHRREIELDDDDLDLIQESRNVHKKLKKTKEIAKNRYDEEMEEPSVQEEENEDFIEQEEGEEGDSPRKRRPARRGGEGYSVLQQVFGQGYEGYQDDEYGEERKDEEEDLPEEDRRLHMKKRYDQMFDPAELQDEFVTNVDGQIAEEDIPERFQTRYKNRLCDNNELVQETNWIADTLILSKGLIDKNSENFRKNIMKVLEFLRISFYEVMYIHTYKANEISLKPGELKLQDLWRIYDLDVEWTSIWSRRKLLEKSFEKVSRFMTIPDLVTQLFNTSFDKVNLDNLLDYCDFQVLLHPEINEAINEDKPFKKATRQIVKPELKAKFEDFALNHLLSADNFGENIYEAKMKNVPPYVEELLTELTYKRYVDQNIPKISNPEAFLTELCNYVAQELFSHPIIRKVVYRQYVEKILVSTEPTAKGKKEIDVYNINYSVKRIDGRLLKDMDDEIWFRAIQNEKEGKIKIKFHFRWKDFISDEIFAFLKNFYLYDAKIKNEASSQWNILRTEILTILLKTQMYPYMERLIRQILTENAEKKIIQECGKKFKEMISAAPYTKSEGDDVLSEIRVMSLIPDENNKIICVVVDKYGEFMDHRTYSYLLVNVRDDTPGEYKSQQAKEEADLKKFVEKYTPDLLVVGADNLSAKSLVKYLRGQKSKWSDDVNQVWIKYGDMTAPKIYAKMEISKKELKDHPIRLKEAISLARLQQSPLHECLKLWHHRKEENGTLYIVFHDLQSFVNQDKLLQELEKAAIEVTNQVGIEINKVLLHPHLSHPVQFICGLGPRKANKILNTLNQKLLKLSTRREMAEDKIVGKNIFTNMSGFIKVEGDDGKDLLDTTRIHPNDYRLAQKIAKDALDDVEHTDDYIKTIMEKPQKLDELDLDDYATHLETKGKQNMKIVLDFIVNELTRPFADPRGAHKEMDHKELFYKMTKMHPFDLQHGSLVNAKIIRVTDKNLICRLECGIEGNVHQHDVFDGKELQPILSKKYREGQVVTARVNSTSFDDKFKKKEDDNKPVDFTKLYLQLKPSIVTDHQKYLKELHPSTVNNFKIVPEEDFPVTQSGISKPVRHYARKINHPKFKNTSAQGALSYLEDKEIGDYIVRPSSKGMDHLTLTWKFYDGIYVHLDIKESAKGPTDKIGRKLHLKDQIYESIEELAAGYIHACNSFVKNIVSNPKFLNDNPARIEEIIKQEKEENPKLIPYRFGFTAEAPQFAILYYAPKDYNIVKEYIRVRPNGLYFHEKVLQNLGQLISWFKSNYHKPEYHKFLKHAKPPVSLPRTNTQVKGEKIEPQGPNTPTHLGRGFDDIKVKTERDKEMYVKQEKGINVKEEENRGGYGTMDRDRNRQNRGGGRGYQGDDRNRSRDFNRDNRAPRERSKSREREKERDRMREYRGGNGGGRDQNRGDRYNDRDRSNNDRRGYGRENQQGGERRGSYNRGDRNDSGRKEDFKEKREGTWGTSPRGAGWSGRPSSGWGGNPGQEEARGNDNWGPSDNQWGNENTGDNGQGMKVKTEWKGNQPESGTWGAPNQEKMNVENAPVRVKQESDWGNNQEQNSGW